MLTNLLQKDRPHKQLVLLEFVIVQLQLLHTSKGCTILDRIGKATKLSLTITVPKCQFDAKIVEILG